MRDSKPAVLGGPAAFPELLRFARPWVPSQHDVTALVDRVRSSRWLTNQGPEAGALAVEIGRFLGVEQCAVVCSGTLGLMLALKALGVRGRILVPAFTFAATAHAVIWAGCEPVFVDVEPVQWTLDPSSAGDALHSTADVKAIIGVHLFGNPCDAQAIQDLADARGLRVVYDAAHVFGTSVRGRCLAHEGDASVYSFHATKPFHTGEGGAVVSPHEGLVRRVQALRNFGFVRGADCDEVGLNAKLAEVPAGMGRILLGRLSEHVSRRNKVITLYREGLRDIPGIALHPLRPGVAHNGSYCPVLVNQEQAGMSRDDLYWALMEERIETRPYFTPPLHMMAAYRSGNPVHLPVSERLSREVLCLPVYSDMSDDEARSIVRAISRIAGDAHSVRAALTERDLPSLSP
jgi:dTDP-4-amino-4,6-dideoxygalactose transaminase